MDRSLTNFIRALRAADVPVSTTEAIDAMGAASLIGFNDRSAFKEALGCVLAKSEDEFVTFDRLFDLYFSRPDRQTSAQNQTRNEEEQSENPSSKTQNQDAAAPQSGPPTGGGTSGGLAELIQSGDETQISLALEQAAQAVGADDIRFSTQTAYVTRQMLEQLGVRELEENLIDLLRTQTDDADAAAQVLTNARAEMMARARAFVEQRFELFGRGATEDFMNDFVARKPMNQLDRRDMERMKVLIAKIAKRLAVKHSRRGRKRNRGKLDVRRTIKQNIRYDGVPFELSWKQKRRDRPKFVVVCDVSGSVSQYVRFLLLLLYSLNDVVSDIWSFAFSNRLYSVDALLERTDFETAFAKILHQAGGGSTDYGQALSDLKVRHWSLIDRRTTLIVIGDGRSNYGDPRLDIFKEAAARAKQTIWLCPEAMGLWGSGDSEMLRYKPICSVVSDCATARDLERSIDDILIAYS